MARAKTYEPDSLGFSQEYIDECVRNAKPFPYGAAYVNKKGTTVYKTPRDAPKDLSGYRFGSLVVLGKAPDYVTPCNGQYKSRWYCWCVESGAIGIHMDSSLKAGDSTRSQRAGVNRGLAAANGRDVSELGDASHPLYQTWSSIKKRCENPKYVRFDAYGGRGIYLELRWQDREVFYADVGDRPSDEHEIERIDINGPYAAWNCCWLHKRLQFATKREALPYATILALREQGLNCSEIARRVGASRWGVSFVLQHPHREEIAEYQLNPPRAFRPDLKPPDVEIERHRNEPHLVALRETYRAQLMATERHLLKLSLDNKWPILQADFKLLDLKRELPKRLHKLVVDWAAYDSADELEAVLVK